MDSAILPYFATEINSFFCIHFTCKVSFEVIKVQFDVVLWINNSFLHLLFYFFSCPDLWQDSGQRSLCAPDWQRPPCSWWLQSKVRAFTFSPPVFLYFFSHFASSWCNTDCVPSLFQVWQRVGDPAVCGGWHRGAEESPGWYQHEQDEHRERDGSCEGGARLPEEEPRGCEFISFMAFISVFFRFYGLLLILKTKKGWFRNQNDVWALMHDIKHEISYLMSVLCSNNN